MECKGWHLFCEHKAPGFVDVVKEFYANMVGMKDKVVYVRGKWIPFGREQNDQTYNLQERKNGSKFKRLLEKPNYQKIVDRLTEGKGKWNSIRKNPHEFISRGALTEPVKVWFYFFMFSHATFQTFMHGQGEGGGIIICHPQGLQIQCGKDNRKLNYELLKRRLQRADPSPSTDFKTLHLGGCPRRLGRKGELPQDITPYIN